MFNKAQLISFISLYIITFVVLLHFRRHICLKIFAFSATRKIRQNILRPIKCTNDEYESDFNMLIFLLLLLPSALQPLWALACSTIVEYSQQEGFYWVSLPAARQTPNLEDQWLEHSNSRHKESPASETTQVNPSSGRWNYGREIAENFAESGDFHVTFGFFYMP